MNKTFIMIVFGMLAFATFSQAKIGLDTDENTMFSFEQLDDGIECNICHFVADKVADYLEQNKTETQILTEIEKVCQFFGKYQSTCSAMIEQYGKEIITNIEEYGKDHVCELIGLCADNYLMFEATIVKIPMSCPICQFIAKEIGEFIKQGKSVDFMEKELNLICEKLGGKVGETCSAIVKAELPAMIKFIVDNGIDKACDFIGICKEFSSPKTPIVDNGLDKCTICEFVVGEIERLLEDGKTEKEILDELNKMCNYFPKEDERAECDDFLDSFAELLVKLIIKYETPEVLCDQLHIC
jgi:saposin